MNDSNFFPRRPLGIWTAIIILISIAPMVVVFLVSFAKTKYNSLPTTGFSLQWYYELLNWPSFLTAGINSFVLALQAGSVAVVVGVLTSLAIVRYTFRLRNLVNVLGSSPLFFPQVLIGLAILLFFAHMGWIDARWRLFAGHVAITLPYVIRTVTASLTGFDPNQELAAMSLGASRWKAFWFVTIPQIGPGIFAGGLFAFIVSFDNVGVSLFLAGARYPVLPVALYSYASYNNDSMAAAVSVVMMVFSIATIMLVEKAFGLQKLLAGEVR